MALSEADGLQGAEEIRRRAIVGVVTVGLRGVGIRLLGLLGYLVTARLLAPSDFGLAALGLSITTAAHLVADGGLGAALLRSPETPDRRDYAAVVGLQTTILSAAALGCLVWAFLSGSRAAVVTTIFVSSVPLFSFRVPAAISLERDLRFGPNLKSDIAEVLVYNLWIVGGAVAGLGVFALASGTVVKTIVGTSVLNRLSPTGFVRPSLEFRRLKGLLRFGLTYQATSVVGLVRDQAINLGTAAVAGYGTLGLWVIAGRVINVPLIVFESLMRVSFPTMSRLQATGVDLAQTMERQTRRFAVLAGFVLAPAAVAGPALLPALLGHQWDDAALVMPFVLLGITLSQPISVIASGYLLAAGDASAVFRTSVAIGVAQIVVTAATLPTVGYVGLGLGSLAGAVADSIALSRAAKRHTGARLLSGASRGALIYLPAVGAGLLVLQAGDDVAVGAAAVATTVMTYLALASFVDRPAVSGLVQLVGEVPALIKGSR